MNKTGKMEVVLIDCEDKVLNVVSMSGLKFCDRFIITVGTIIAPFLKDETDFSNSTDELNKKFTFFVTTINVDGVLIRYRANISAVFESANLKTSLDLFRGWTIGFSNNPLENKMLSVFFILDIDCIKNKLVMRELGHLKAKMLNLRREIFKGREILVESVPFGNKHFINSHSCGIVSNVLGKNNCFILSDCPTVPGSEGSPVFFKDHNAERVPFGIVVSSLSWWQGEWIGMTICVNLPALLEELFTEKLHKYSENTLSSFAEEKFLLQVTCAGQWGTAILLNKNEGILLTNSHVVSKGQKIDLRWNDCVFPGEILYQTPRNSPCDLAFLKADAKHFTFMENVRFARNIAVKGETVYAAGYSLFKQQIQIQPILSRGIISQVSFSMIKTSCCINPGASGGALIRPNGELLGIIVGNVKFIEKEKSTFPRVNMCIPISAVKGVIERFLQILDIEVLRELERVDLKLWRDWIVLQSKL